LHQRLPDGDFAHAELRGNLILLQGLPALQLSAQNFDSQSVGNGLLRDNGGGLAHGIDRIRLWTK
jgi:hypothetical protein